MGEKVQGPNKTLPSTWKLSWLQLHPFTHAWHSHLCSKIVLQCWIFSVVFFLDRIISFSVMGWVLEPIPATYGQRCTAESPAYCRALCENFGARYLAQHYLRGALEVSQHFPQLPEQFPCFAAQVHLELRTLHLSAQSIGLMITMCFVQNKNHNIKVCRTGWIWLQNKARSRRMGNCSTMLRQIMGKLFSGLDRE